MKPVEVVGNVFGRHAAEAAKESLERFMAAVDGLDMEFASDALAGRLVEGFMRNAQLGGAGGIISGAIGDEERIPADGGFEDGFDGLTRDRGQDRGQRASAAVGRHQDRHLFVRQAALGGFPAAVARFPFEGAIAFSLRST